MGMSKEQEKMYENEVTINENYERMRTMNIDGHGQDKKK